MTWISSGDDDVREFKQGFIVILTFLTEHTHAHTQTYTQKMQ